MVDYSDKEKLEDIHLILSRMHHNDYEIHTQDKVCGCSICKDVLMILRGEKPKVLELFKSSTKQAADLRERIADAREASRPRREDLERQAKPQATRIVCNCTCCQIYRKG